MTDPLPSYAGAHAEALGLVEELAAAINDQPSPDSSITWSDVAQLDEINRRIRSALWFANGLEEATP